MKAISDIKLETPKSKATSERATMIEYFVNPLVEERRNENFERFKRWVLKNPGKTAEDFKKTKEYLKPLTAQSIAVKMAHIPTDQLYQFFSDCARYKGGFSKAWFGALKVRE